MKYWGDNYSGDFVWVAYFRTGLWTVSWVKLQSLQIEEEEGRQEVWTAEGREKNSFGQQGPTPCGMTRVSGNWPISRSSCSVGTELCASFLLPLVSDWALNLHVYRTGIWGSTKSLVLVARHPPGCGKRVQEASSVGQSWWTHRGWGEGSYPVTFHGAGEWFS